MPKARPEAHTLSLEVRVSDPGCDPPSPCRRAPFAQAMDSSDHVYVWTLPTTASNEILSNFEQLLTADELDHATQIRSLRQRQSFIVTRGTLRSLLGCFLAIEPQELQFDYGPKGKPVLSTAAEVSFNVSHSSEMAAIALTRGCDVGIDLEEIRTLPELEQIVRQFFRSEEAAKIMVLPCGERERAFFACWTRKEAYVKATGSGLSKSPDSFSVTERAEKDGTFDVLEEGAPSSEPWTVQDLCFSPDYAAALAYRDRRRPLTILRLHDLEKLFETTCEHRKPF